MLPGVLVVYHKPSCSTCKNLRALLAERGIEHRLVDYYREPFDLPGLRALLARTGRPAREFLRTRGRPDLAAAEWTDEQLLGLMAADPDLIQRPIVDDGTRAVLARPIERALELHSSE